MLRACECLLWRTWRGGTGVSGRCSTMAWLACRSDWFDQRNEALLGGARVNVGDGVGAAVTHLSLPRPGQPAAVRRRAAYCGRVRTTAARRGPCLCRAHKAE